MSDGPGSYARRIPPGSSPAPGGCRCRAYALFRAAQFLLIPSLLCAGAAAGFSAPSGATTVHLQLHGALSHGDGPAAPPRVDLALELQYRFGTWGPTLGIARDFNMGTHWGYLDRVVLTDNSLEATAFQEIAGDPWVKGGRADFTVQAKREGQSLTGTYEGSFRGQHVKGAVTGLVLDSVSAAGFVPLARGEHPRVLFRKADLPRVRRLLATPFGHAALEAMRRDPVYKTQSPLNDQDSGISQGIKYQITGDRAFAEKAWRTTEATMADKSRAPFVPEVSMAWQIERVALAYDLCYDAWSEPARQQVRGWLLDWYQRLVRDAQAIYRQGNWHVGSNHSAHFYGAIGVVGLVLFDDPGPVPAPPWPRWFDALLPPAQDLTVKPGTPVVPLVDGPSPTDWLLAAPFPSMLKGDPMGGLHGLESLNPGPGDTATVEGMTISFQPIADADKPREETGGIATERLLKSGGVSLAAYTVIECREPGHYKLLLPFSLAGRPQIALNGKLLAHEQVVRLEKGRYPAMLLLRLGAKWGTVAPRFVKATEADVAAWEKALPDLRVSVAREADAAAVAVAFHNASGGADPELEKLFRWTRWHMWIFARDIVGEGGTGYEAGIDYDIHRYAAGYHAAYRRIFGHPLSPFPDFSHLLPRRMMQAVYTPDGFREGLDMNGSAKLDLASLAAEFALTPDDWKPAALWTWQQKCGVRDPFNPVEVLGSGRAAAEALLSYPYELTRGGSTIAPAFPGDFLPRTWAAPYRGHYIFRNGAASADNCILQVYAKSREISGWESGNAGAFRLYGLGFDWVINGKAEHNTSLRMQESVVDLPDDSVYATACGRVLEHVAKPDGSGFVLVDLADVYSAAGKGSYYQTYGGGRREGAFRESGIRGWRTIGVDYSGSSGAPCVLILADKIEGGGRKVWRWPLGNLSGDAAVTDGGFTLKQGNATLSVTFLSPKGVKVRSGEASGSYLEPTFKRQRTDTARGVFAEVAQGDAWIVAVATLQRDEPPKVTMTGALPDGTVSVGPQTLRIVDGKVAFGR